jgi:hypothetical protein
VQAACEPSTRVQTGFAARSGSVAPWQYTEQVASARLHEAAAPFGRATAPKVTWTAPSGWFRASGAGTAWHASQGTGAPIL